MRNAMLLFGFKLNPLRVLALLALAAFTVVIPSCSASEPDRVPAPLSLETQAATCTCPPSDECGKYTCSVFPSGCTWTALLKEGDPCKTAVARGHCVTVPTGRTTPEHLECCDGCASKDGCHAGTENGYCGGGGTKCDACGPCETCSDQKCVPTTGNACGTCRTCSEGACKDDAVGESCSGGRCAAGAVCCSGCIDANGQCLSSTDATCGTSGAACVSCGQCGTCSGGSCSPRDSGSCDDGNPCTSGDACSAGTCTGTGVSIDDGNPCTDDACAPETGVTHTSVAEGTACPDDGSSCTSDERCTDQDADPSTPRICLPATGTTCADGNPCTSDAPDCTDGSCPLAPLDQQPCSTGNRCILNELCQGSTCTGEARNCSDDNPCTTDSCHVEDGEGIDPVTGCLHAPKKTSVACDDSNDCTTDDHCGGDGSCAGDTIVCEALDNCHAQGTCDPGSGDCTAPRLQDDTACGRTGLCDKGVCKGDTPEPSTGGTGAGGAAGEAGTTSSAGTTGSSSGGKGGKGGATSAGGTGDTGTAEGGSSGDVATTTGGTTSGGTSGKGGSVNSGGSGDTTGEGAAAGEPYHRDPGGCSCNVPAERKSTNFAWVAGLVGMLAFRRRRTSLTRQSADLR